MSRSISVILYEQELVILDGGKMGILWADHHAQHLILTSPELRASFDMMATPEQKKDAQLYRYRT